MVSRGAVERQGVGRQNPTRIWNIHTLSCLSQP